MLLILSEEIDRSTDITCGWLNNYNIRFIRLNNEKDFNSILDIKIDSEKFNIRFKHKDKIFSLHEITAVWYRRGYLRFSLPNISILGYNKEVTQKLFQHILMENEALEDFIYSVLNNRKHVNYPKEYNINKLKVLNLARQVGLQIPDTLVTEDINLIKDFNSKHCNIITKNIHTLLNIKFNQNFITQRTEEVREEEIDDERYHYSLFQKKIDKKYELRILYFAGKFYSAAIFSQLNSLSLIDFRNENTEKPNRIVPYILPKGIKMKLALLMKKLCLESGSIDIIVDKGNNYIFLEVNPVGQFDFISKSCNYYIERDIAKYFGYAN